MENELVNTAINAMHAAGISTRAAKQIGNVIAGMNHVSIARRLKKLTPRKTTEIYRELKPDVLAEKQRQILMLSATPGAQNGRDQRDYATAFGVFYDKERLERGQSTENIGYLDYNRALDQLQEERRRLAHELGFDEDAPSGSTTNV